MSRQSHVRQAQADSVEHRAERAQVFSRLGELYSARQALGGSCVAPGNLATLDSLTNKDRRPPRQRDPLPQSATENQAAFPLHPESFLRNVRCAQKGLRRLFDMTALVPTAVSPIVTLSTTLTFHNVNHNPMNPRNPKSQTPNPRPQTKRKTTLGVEPRFFVQRRWRGDVDPEIDTKLFASQQFGMALIWPETPRSPPPGDPPPDSSPLETPSSWRPRFIREV